MSSEMSTEVLFCEVFWLIVVLREWSAMVVETLCVKPYWFFGKRLCV